MALNYNGVEFEPINTNVHVYGPVKDPSGSDQLYTEAVLTIRSVLNLAYSPSISGELVVGGVSRTLTRIRHLLTQPRRPLYYDVVSAAGARSAASAIFNITDGRDDAGGVWPDAKAFDVQYTTPGSFEVTWSCTVRIRDCGATNPDQNSPLSLRWEDSISWDETWKATFNRSGTLIISSRQQRTIDWFRRNRLGLPVPSGFHRTNAKYLCSRDGLRCDFNFTDSQITFAPPYPGVKMKIVQSETAPTVGGMKKGAVSVTIIGIFNANVRDLAVWAMVIMKSRVWSSNKLIFQGIVPGVMNLETQEMSDGSPVVTATCQYKVNPDSTREKEVSSKRNWGGAVGFIVGGPGGALLGSTIGRVIDPPKTQQNKTPVGTSPYPWIGYGTTPATIYNPQGYQPWANPTGAVGGSPPDGVGMASAISLFAALLNDPCGNQVSTTPYALVALELNQNVNLTLPPLSNTAVAGQAGQPNTTAIELQAASSGLNANQYPSTSVTTDKEGLIKWDGQPGAYDHWQCLNEYVDEMGVAVLPTANPSGTNIKVNYGSHMITLIERWAAKRAGAPPTVPYKAQYKIVNGRSVIDTNWVYIGGAAPQIRELGVAPDGVSIIYEASGYYIFQALDATLVDYEACVPPTLDDKQLIQPKGWFQRQTDTVEITVGGPTVDLTGSGGTSPVLGSGVLPGTAPGGNIFNTGSGPTIDLTGMQSPSGIVIPAIGPTIDLTGTGAGGFVPPPAGVPQFGAGDPLAPTFNPSTGSLPGSPATDPFFTNPQTFGSPVLGTGTLPNVPAP